MAGMGVVHRLLPVPVPADTTNQMERKEIMVSDDKNIKLIGTLVVPIGEENSIQDILDRVTGALSGDDHPASTAKPAPVEPMIADLPIAWQVYRDTLLDAYEAVHAIEHSAFEDGEYELLDLTIRLVSLLRQAQLVVDRHLHGEADQ